MDKNQPATDISTLDEIVSDSAAQHRMVMVILLSFAALALLLSAMGIYSVLSYSISQRTREIGLRMAFGAGQATVLRLVIGGGMRLTAFGVVIGIVTASALTQFMKHLLYGVGPMDLPTFSAVTIILATTALVASWAPARRATNVDPIKALRHE